MHEAVVNLYNPDERALGITALSSVFLLFCWAVMYSSGVGFENLYYAFAVGATTFALLFSVSILVYESQSD